MKECPYCTAPNQDSLIVCQYCGRNIRSNEKATPTTVFPKVSTPDTLVSKVPISAESKPKKSSGKKVILYIIGGVLALSVICCASALIYSVTPQGKANSTQMAQNRTLAALYTATQTKTPKPTRTTRPTSTSKPTRTSGPTDTPLPSKTPGPTDTATSTATPVIDSSVKVIMDDAMLTQLDAEAAFEVLKSVGYKDVDHLTFTSGTDNEKEYKVAGNCDWSDCHSVYFLVFTDNKVTYIGKLDITLYDIELGGIVDNASNYYLTDDEKYTFQDATQMVVEKVLKAPSTADFLDDKWVVVREKDLVEVWGSVDAENSFGAMLRNDFYAEWSYSTGNPIYLNFAGTIVYGSSQKP